MLACLPQLRGAPQNFVNRLPQCCGKGKNNVAGLPQVCGKPAFQLVMRICAAWGYPLLLELVLLLRTTEISAKKSVVEKRFIGFGVLFGH